MSDVSCILQQCTDRSLVLLDELGRSTAAEEGAGLTWAVCEHLLLKGCRTLAATHYQQCSRMADMYHQVTKLVAARGYVPYHLLPGLKVSGWKEGICRQVIQSYWE